MRPDGHDITKLPKWAQREIEISHNSVGYWRDKFERAEAGDTEVFIRNYGVPNDGLPPESTISFIIQDRENDNAELGRFDVKLKGGALEVMGVGQLMSDQLRTKARSSNILYIELTPWEETK